MAGPDRGRDAPTPGARKLDPIRLKRICIYTHIHTHTHIFPSRRALHDEGNDAAKFKRRFHAGRRARKEGRRSASH